MNDEEPTILKIYAELMEEARIRLDFIALTISEVGKNPDDDTNVFRAENTFLQVRFLCEITALAALAAHDGLELNAHLRKGWNADDIFTRLEQINPVSFPRPMVVNRVEHGWHLEPNREARMDRRELRDIYSRCGEHLHRGTAKSVFSGAGKNYDMNEVDAYSKRIGSLLSTHVVMVPELKRAFMSQLCVVPGGHSRTVAIGSEGDQEFIVGDDF